MTIQELIWMLSDIPDKTKEIVTFGSKGKLAEVSGIAEGQNFVSIIVQDGAIRVVCCNCKHTLKDQICINSACYLFNKEGKQ